MPYKHITDSITLFRSGDTVQHLKTGYTYTVQYALIMGYKLTVVMTDDTKIPDYELRNLSLEKQRIA